PILISYLKGVPLPQLHPSLNNLLKLDALIASRKRAEHPYGQNIYGQYFVFCGYKQQIEGLKKSKYIEIDMSFKRVHGSINEWEICAYSEAHQKKLFLCIEQDTKKPIKFNHIHNQGIGCILADEHRGQALDWVQDKKQNWVLAALSPAFTKMVHHIWINTPFTTNASESAHATINTTGPNFDSHQWSTAITYEKTNIQDSYRNKSSLQCTINSAKRKQKQSTKQSIKPSTTKPKKKARYNKESSSNESSITYEQKQLLNIN
ncbi:19833_t:CDS:2, partial [Gigaspora rosea]